MSCEGVCATFVDFCMHTIGGSVQIKGRDTRRLSYYVRFVDTAPSYNICKFIRVQLICREKIAFCKSSLPLDLHRRPIVWKRSCRYLTIQRIAIITPTVSGTSENFDGLFVTQESTTASSKTNSLDFAKDFSLTNCQSHQNKSKVAFSQNYGTESSFFIFKLLLNNNEKAKTNFQLMRARS